MPLKEEPENFEKEIKRRIEDLSTEKKIYFAWLCAVRAVPFLATRRNFNYWKDDKKLVYLQDVFYAQDIAACVASDSDFNADAFDAFDAFEAYAAYDAYDAFDDAASSAVFASAAASAATAATATVATATVATDATVADAVAAVASAAENASSAQNNKTKYSFRKILFEDLKLIQQDQYNNFNNDTAIYGTLWENFMIDLTELGCSYWSYVYSDLFKNGFQQDLETVQRRLDVPIEIRSQGAVAVANYLERIENQGLVYAQRETRLIILGSAGAGKTTLAKRLNDDMTHVPIGDSTHGVDTSIKLYLNGVKTHVWDFGGQVMYHASHRCFITKNCVYVLVVNARTEEHRDIFRIRYWLETIGNYSQGDAKVFILVNESDNRKLDNSNFATYKKGEFGSMVLDIYSFNIDSDAKMLLKFKKSLADYIEKAGHQVFGQNDDKVIQEIFNLFKEKNNQVIHKSVLEDVLTKHGINGKDNRKYTIRLLDTLGIALSYDKFENYVIDPYWISHGVYCVIDYLKNKNSNTINESEIDMVFFEEGEAYLDKAHFILDLIKNYKIGLPIPGVAGLIIPCMAPLFKPENVTIDIDQDNLITEVRRDDSQEFPSDFFYKYMGENHSDFKRKGEDTYVYQTSMLLSQKNRSAYIELLEDRTIRITTWGTEKKEYQKQLEERIYRLLEEYSLTAEKNEIKIRGAVRTLITLIKPIYETTLESIAKGMTEAYINRNK